MLLAGKTTEQIVRHMNNEVKKRKKKEEEVKAEFDLIKKVKENEIKLKTAEVFLKNGIISKEDYDKILNLRDEDLKKLESLKEKKMKKFSPEYNEVQEISSKDDKVEDKKEEAVEKPEKTEEVEEKEEPKSENKQDVPEEIIDNFAAMFNSNNTEGTTVASVDSSKKIGDGAQTVEDLIKAVLRESLKPSIEDAMTKIDEDMLVEAKAAVEVEAKAWVNKNLTRVVEEIVREEVRRVMAKVGS